MENLMADALEQLNEQEAIPVDTQEAIQVDTKVIGTLNGDMEVYCCRNCRTILDPAFDYCPNCGQKVKWE
jgi:rubrerythrin